MPSPKLILLPDGNEAKVCVQSADDEQEDGEINDEDEEENGVDGKRQQLPSLPVSEVQAFVIACLLPEPRLSRPPKWCRVMHCTKASRVGIFLLNDHDINGSGGNRSRTLNQFKFQHAFRYDTQSDWIDQLVNVTLSRRLREAQQQEAAEEVQRAKTTQAPMKEIVPRTSLLLSPIQMIIEKFPVPDEQIGFLRSKFKKVTDDSPLFALDCEMCITTARISELTRVSVVDENCEVVYDSLVKPPNEIANYLTKYSGITPELMKDVTTTLEDVHVALNKRIPRDAILCGQSLNNDFAALKIFHPYVIDTSIIYNMSGYRPQKPSLKSLAYTFLDRDIQTSAQKGHDSVEDAITCMELIKLKLANGLSFGDQVLKDCEVGVKFDSKTGYKHIPIHRFVERHNFNVTFGKIDPTPGGRFIHLDDENNEQTLDDSVSDAIQSLIDEKRAICVAITSSGLCYVKF